MTAVDGPNQLAPLTQPLLLNDDAPCSLARPMVFFFFFFFFFIIFLLAFFLR